MNVQQTIIKGIKEQLLFNNYLVLPNFGGFVLKLAASHFSASGGLLLPQSKTVSFNAQLKQNDGIMAIWLQNILKCNANEAINHLHDFSEFCSGVLNAKRRFTLEGIGFFYLDFENNICFEPQQDSNFLSTSFGLSPLSVRELQSEPVVTHEPKKDPVFVDRKLSAPEIFVEPVRNKRNYSRLVTPLLVAILFVSLLGLLVNNSSMKGELRSSLIGGDVKASYNPLIYKDLNLLSNNSNPKVYVADANGIAVIELEADKKISLKAIENSFNKIDLNSSKSIHNNNLSKGKFEIVLGCFTVLENARRMVNKLSLQKINAAVTGKNNKGMYVVSNGIFATKEEAIHKLIEVKEGFPNAWIKAE